MSKVLPLCFFVFALVLLTGSPAASAELPQYDIKAYCQTVAQAGGGSSMIELGCRDMEKEALATLTRSTIPEKILNYCSSVAKTGGGSYSLLQGCVDMELNAAKQLQ